MFETFSKLDEISLKYQQALSVLKLFDEFLEGEGLIAGEETSEDIRLKGECFLKRLRHFYMGYALAEDQIQNATEELRAAINELFEKLRELRRNAA